MTANLSINGFLLTSGQPARFTIVDGSTRTGVVTRTGSNVVVIRQADGESIELGQSSITHITQDLTAGEPTDDPSTEALSTGRRVAWTLIDIAQTAEKALAWVYEGSQLAKARGVWTNKMADQYAGMNRALLEVQDAQSIVRALLLAGSDKDRVREAIEQGAANLKAIDAWDEQYEHFHRAQRWALDNS